MTQEKLKQFLDACFDAKRLIEKLPDLPDGMKPRQVHVLDAVNEIQKKQGFCRVSDISSYMNTTLPSITKLGIGSSIRKAFILRSRSERLSVCSST